MKYTTSVFYADRSTAYHLSQMINAHNSEDLPMLAAPAPRFQLRSIATGTILAVAVTEAPLRRSVLAAGCRIEPVDPAEQRERRRIALARRRACGDFRYDPRTAGVSRARGGEARRRG